MAKRMAKKRSVVLRKKTWQPRETSLAFRRFGLGAIMSDQENKGPVNDADRRLFLEKAGRFAAVTPPTIALMLSATGKARAQTTSGKTTVSMPTFPPPGPA